MNTDRFSILNPLTAADYNFLLESDHIRIKRKKTLVTVVSIIALIGIILAIPLASINVMATFSLALIYLAVITVIGGFNYSPCASLEAISDDQILALTTWVNDFLVKYEKFKHDVPAESLEVYLSRLTDSALKRPILKMEYKIIHGAICDYNKCCEAFLLQSTLKKALKAINSGDKS